MLRFATRESYVVVAVRQGRPRAVPVISFSSSGTGGNSSTRPTTAARLQLQQQIQRRRVAASAHAGGNSNATKRASSEPSSSSPLELVFQQRLEETRIRNAKLKATTGTLSAAASTRKGGSGGLSHNLRSTLRQRSQHEPRTDGVPPHFSGIGKKSNTDGLRKPQSAPRSLNRFGRISRNGGQPREGSSIRNHGNVNPQQGHGAAAAASKSKSSAAASIREMLAQQSTVGSKHRMPVVANKTASSSPSSSVSIANKLKRTASSRNSRTATAGPTTTRRGRQDRRPSSMAQSIREMLDPTSTRAAAAAATKATTSTLSQDEPKRDMSDISSLRMAFLKTIEVQKHQRAQERHQQRAAAAAERLEQSQQHQQPAWRRDGAKGFRKRLQEQQREQMEKLEHQRRMRAAVNRNSGASFMTQEDYLQDRHEREEANDALADGADNEDKTVTLPPREATVAELSNLFRVKIDTLLDKLKSLGERPGNSGEEHLHLVDLDVMELLAMELGKEPIRSSRRRTRPDDDKDLLLQRRAGAEAAEVGETEQALAQAEAYESLPPRPPVVCIMGHVDHGKTTLMDALRKRSKGNSEAHKASAKKKKSKSKKGKKGQNSKDDAVAGTEAGGITQVISAFQVPLENQDNAVTFLDTPGHAAFRAMRESGSNAADVIVLVVAADDGVSPQTVEIINFYKSIVKGAGDGGISMVVAMTKIDKHGVEVDESRQRIENQLLEHGILSESFGSSSDSEYGPPVQVVPVSGLTGEGLDDLIEGLVLQSEVMDLRADEKAQAEGIVMDARMEKGVGVVADCIVRWGSLGRGDVVVSGVHSGKVKALKDMSGTTVTKAAPSQPIRIFGFKSLPKAGDPIICVHSEEVADQITERREALQDAEDAARTSSSEAAEMQVMGTAAKRGSSMEATLIKYGQDGEADESQIRIPVIIRADGEGSLAALKESLVAVGEESSFDLTVDTINAGIGPISTSDVRMAIESGASIFSFGVKQNEKTAFSMAEAEGVRVLSHDVIYSLLDEAKTVFAERLPASPVDVVHGRAKVQAIFDVNNKKDAERIAGLAVLDGTLYRGKAKGSNGEPVECQYRVLRNGSCISEGESLKVSSLRKVKEDVDDVRRGEECGLGLTEYTDYENGDIIECFSVEMKREFV